MVVRPTDEDSTSETHQTALRCLNLTLHLLNGRGKAAENVAGDLERAERKRAADEEVS